MTNKEMFEDLKKVFREIDPNIEVFPTKELEAEIKKEEENEQNQTY